MTTTLFDLFNKGISEKFFLKYIIRKNVVPEYKFWKSLGLFEINKDNKILTDEEQFEIYKKEVLDVKDNVEHILELADDESDINVPIEELIGDIDDVDIKRHIEDYLDKEGAEDG